MLAVEMQEVHPVKGTSRDKLAPTAAKTADNEAMVPQEPCPRVLHPVLAVRPDNCTGQSERTF